MTYAVISNLPTTPDMSRRNFFPAFSACLFSDFESNLCRSQIHTPPTKAISCFHTATRTERLELWEATSEGKKIEGYIMAHLEQHFNPLTPAFQLISQKFPVLLQITLNLPFLLLFPRSSQVGFSTLLINVKRETKCRPFCQQPSLPLASA